MGLRYGELGPRLLSDVTLMPIQHAVWKVGDPLMRLSPGRLAAYVGVGCVTEAMQPGCAAPRAVDRLVRAVGACLRPAGGAEPAGG